MPVVTGRASRRRTLKPKVSAAHTGSYDACKAWEALAGWLVNAYCDAEEATFESPTGNVRDKTRKQREIDHAVRVALCRVAADFPGQPLGMTESAVLLNLRDLDDQYPTT